MIDKKKTYSITIDKNSLRLDDTKTAKSGKSYLKGSVLTLKGKPQYFIAVGSAVENLNKAIRSAHNTEKVIRFIGYYTDGKDSSKQKKRFRIITARAVDFVENPDNSSLEQS